MKQSLRPRWNWSNGSLCSSYICKKRN